MFHKTALATAFALATSAAQALVTFTGSIDQAVTPPDDDFAPGQEVLFGREVTIDQLASIRITAIFSEADYRNAFITVGDTTYSDVIDGSSLTFNYGPGLLPFAFHVTDTGESVINGGNQFAWESASPSPFYAVTPVKEVDGASRFYIALNDNGFGDETSGDLDLDDYVLQVDVVAQPASGAEVPEPMPAALLGLGLVGIGLTRLKRKV